MDTSTNTLFKGTLPLGSIRGIPIRLSFSFLVLLACIVAWAAFFFNAPMAVLYFLLMGPVLLLTVLVHELGHCLATRAVGGDAYGILLWPLGGLAYVGHDTGPKADIWVAVAGPVTHIPMILLWLLLYVPVYYGRFHTAHITFEPQYATWRDLGVNLCQSAVVMNVVLLVFNLCVPAYPLDGGRILADLLLICGLSEVTAAYVVVGVAIPISLIIIALGVVYWTSAASLITLLVGGWILITTILLLRTAMKGDIKRHPLFAFNSNQPAIGAAALQPMAPPAQGNPYVQGGQYNFGHNGQYNPGHYNGQYHGQQLVCALFMLGHPDLQYVFPEAAAAAAKKRKEAHQLNS